MLFKMCNVFIEIVNNTFYELSVFLSDSALCGSVLTPE